MVCTHRQSAAPDATASRPRACSCTRRATSLRCTPLPRGAPVEELRHPRVRVVYLEHQLVDEGLRAVAQHGVYHGGDSPLDVHLDDDGVGRLQAQRVAQ